MKKIINTDKAPAAVGPYSQAVVAGGFIFASGQIPLDPETGLLVEGGIESEARQSLENLEVVLKAGGSSLGHVVKTTIFLTDMNDFAAVNGVYSEFFTENQPTRACVEVSRLPKGAHVEIEAIAVAE